MELVGKGAVASLGLAALVVLVGVGLTVLGGYVVCRDELAAVGNNAVVRTCGPLGLTDLPVVASVLLLVVVLGPDLSEVSIGVLSLKQRVKDTQQDQKEIREEFEGLKQSFTLTASARAEQATSVATSVEAPDLAGLVRETFKVVSRDPALAGAEGYAGGVDPKYTSTLGNVVCTLARLEFLLGSRAQGVPKFRVWIIDIGPSLDMTRLSQSEVFADLVGLMSDKDPKALTQARVSFQIQYARVLNQLDRVRDFAINGVISLEEAERTLKNARALLGALWLVIDQLPRIKRDGATEEKVSADAAIEDRSQENSEAEAPPLRPGGD